MSDESNRLAGRNRFQPDKEIMVNAGKPKLYVRWVWCIQGECPESKDGKCKRGREPEDFPRNGKCRYPDYIPYEDADITYGAFEMAENIERRTVL